MTRPRREVLFVTALVFLLQSILPAFQSVMARSVDGYFDIVCTMSGMQTVFVPLEDSRPQELPVCQECPLCVVPGSFDDSLIPAPRALTTHHRFASGHAIDPVHLTYAPLFYPLFLSRAPPG